MPQVAPYLLIAALLEFGDHTRLEENLAGADPVRLGIDLDGSAPATTQSRSQAATSYIDEPR